MDIQPTPEVAQHQTLQLTKSSDVHHFSKVVLAGVGTLLVIVSALGAGFYLGQNTTPVATVPAELAANPSPTSTDPTANWKTYTVAKINLSFKLPPQFDNYQATEEVVAGEKGSQLCLDLKKLSLHPVKKAFAGGSACFGEILAAGTTSVDYMAGREGGFTDYQGFETKNGTYLVKFTLDKTFPVESDLVKKVTNPNVEIVKILGRDAKNSPFPEAGTPGEGYIGALINTKNSTYPGFAIQLKLGEGVTEEVFDQILSTFTFTN